MASQNADSEGKGERAVVRSPKHPPTTAPRRTATKHTATASQMREGTPVPPRKHRREELVLKHYRLRVADVEQTNAIAAQRRTDPNDIVRRQYERGVLTDSALGAPGEDGLYGLYRGQRLAELLRPDIDGLLGFTLAQGVVPALIQEYRTIIASLNETIQGLRAQGASYSSAALSAEVAPQPDMTAATDISEEATNVLDMFFSGEE